MRRRIGQFGLLLGMLFLLSGCLSQSGESLYALPRLPEDYLALQDTIDGVMSELGAEYAAPTSGSNTQNIQLQDLDGDGTQESAVAYFRVSGAEKPLKIYIFRQNQATEEYETAWSVEGEGTAIYSVAFENLGGTTDKEMIVNWQISTGVQSMAAYSFQSGGDMVELMRSGYTRSAVVDIDRDNEKEIILLQLDAAENNSRAELYNYDGGQMVLTSAAPLSLYITEIQAAKVGSLTNQIPALFVSSDFGENGGRVTDIIALRDDVLTNLTLDETLGMSVGTVRYYKDFQDANGMDINSDGILELPSPEPLPLVDETGAQMYMLHWIQYDLEGTATRVCSTIHCYDDSWYLTLPEEWLGEVTAVRRLGTTGYERSVSFYHLPQSVDEPDAQSEPGDGEEAQLPECFLTIYRLTGSNRTRRATMDNRFVLFETSDVIYAARFWDAEWDCGVNSDELRTQFNRIRVEWSADS